MNRFKKYLRNEKNIKLAADYPWLPYDVKHNIILEDIYVNSSKATITFFYNVGDFTQKVNTDGTLENID